MGHLDSLNKGPVMRNIDVFFVVSLYKLLNTLSLQSDSKSSYKKENNLQISRVNSVSPCGLVLCHGQT